MKVLGKYIVFLSLLTLYFSAFGRPGETWSAPKGKMVVAQTADATTLDHHMHAEISANVVLNNIYDSLIKRIFKDGKIQHQPMLATSWEAVNDTTWIFHLRKGVKFHNGEDFDAEAVKCSIERVLNPAQKARRRYFFYFIDKVEVLDPYTVRITTKTTAALLITNLAYAMPILPPKYTREKGDVYVSTRPVGTGAFKFLRWIKDEEIVLEANENYWGVPPNIKTLIFKPIPEDSTRVAALLSGDVDIIKNVPIHLIPMVNKSGRAKVMTTPGGVTLSVFFDTVKEGSPMRDKRVRQAINYGVDKENIIKHVLEGYAIPVGSPLNPAHFGYDSSLKPYRYDPEKARALLKEAGYGDGLALTFNSPSGRFMKDKELAETIAGQLAKVGINVKVQIHEYGNYMKKVYSPEGAGPMWTFIWAGNLDADGILYPLLSCQASFSRYCNKQLDSYLEQAQITLDPKEREKIYHQALKLIHDEAPFLFLYQPIDAYGVSERVQNWKPGPDESWTLVLHGASVKD